MRGGEGEGQGDGEADDGPTVMVSVAEVTEHERQ